VNQVPSTPVTTPRQKPRTPQHSLRSSRDSPPRFGNDNLDDFVSHGSPLPSMNDDDDDDDAGFTFGDLSEMIIDEETAELELSLNEKHEAIIESIKKIVPDYWDILEQLPFSHARISECCFVVQDFDPKTGYLKVFLRV
jgi:hypothetical protein